MANFKQICRIKTDFNLKQPEIVIKHNERGPSVVGKLTWLDGKKLDGKPDYTWFNFRTSKEELMNVFLENQNATFEVEGWLKNRFWQDKASVWHNHTEILVSKVSVYDAEKKVVPSFHSEENDDTIPF